MVTAWKRRSAGSAYSRAQSGQGGKAVMVLRSRSKGTCVAMVKRGPQAVQVSNGWPARRPAGSRSSAAHSAQVARSAGIGSRLGPSEVLSMMRKPLSPRGVCSSTISSSTRARAGAMARNSRTTAFDHLARTLDLDDDALRRVPDAAGQPARGEGAVEGGAEADALHAAARDEAAAADGAVVGPSLHVVSGRRAEVEFEAAATPVWAGSPHHAGWKPALRSAAIPGGVPEASCLR